MRQVTSGINRSASTFWLAVLATFTSLTTLQRYSEASSVVPYAFRSGVSSAILSNQQSRVVDDDFALLGQPSSGNSDLLLTGRRPPFATTLLVEDSLPADAAAVSAYAPSATNWQTSTAVQQQPPTLPSRCASLLHFLAQIRAANANIVKALDNVLNSNSVNDESSADFGPLLTSNPEGAPAAAASNDSNYSTTTTVISSLPPTTQQQTPSGLYGPSDLSSGQTQQPASPESSSNIGGPVTVLRQPTKAGGGSPAPDAIAVSGIWPPTTTAGNSNNYGATPTNTQQPSSLYATNTINSTTIGQLGIGETAFPVHQQTVQSNTSGSLWTPINNQQQQPTSVSNQFGSYYTPPFAQQPPRQTLSPTNSNFPQTPPSSSGNYGGFTSNQQQQQQQPQPNKNPPSTTAPFGSWYYNPPQSQPPASARPPPASPWASATTSNGTAMPGALLTSNPVGTLVLSIPSNLTEQQSADFCRFHPHCCSLLSQFQQVQQQPLYYDGGSAQQTHLSGHDGGTQGEATSDFADTGQRPPRPAGTSSSYWSTPAASTTKQTNNVTTSTYGILAAPPQSASPNTPPRFTNNNNHQLDSSIYGVPTYSYTSVNQENLNGNQTTTSLYGKNNFGFEDDTTNFVDSSGSSVATENNSDGSYAVSPQVVEISDEPYRQSRSLPPSMSSAASSLQRGRRPSSRIVANDLERLVVQLASASARALEAIVKNNPQMLSPTFAQSNANNHEEDQKQLPVVPSRQAERLILQQFVRGKQKVQPSTVDDNTTAKEQLAMMVSANSTHVDDTRTSSSTTVEPSTTTRKTVWSRKRNEFDQKLTDRASKFNNNGKHSNMWRTSNAQ